MLNQRGRGKSGIERLLNFLASAAFLTLLFGFITTACLYAQRRPAPTKGSSDVWKAPVEANPKDYVGPQTCAACHSAEAQQFFKSPHGAYVHGGAAQPSPARSGPKLVTGCELCHGPGAAHTKAEETAAGNPVKMKAGAKLIYSFNGSPKEDSERCLQCHKTGTPQDSFPHSVHATAGVSCIDCHTIHGLEMAGAGKPQLQPAQAQFFSVPRLNKENAWLTDGLLKEPQPQLCYRCHRTVEAEFALPEHHRVGEGFMKCTDCHNPHGTMNHFQLTHANWETCAKCHVEKRGPFVYEHAVERVEGCTACHNPHGSVNNFMLKRRSTRLLCLQCHSAIHATSGFRGQENVPHGRQGFQTSGPCTRCHVAIHGSNFDEYLLR